MDHEHIRASMANGTADRVVPQWAVGALGEVIHGRRAITAVRHPLGFICLPLWRAGRDGACAHVWTDRFTQASPTTSAMHAHSWDLTSYVLYGRLRNELVNVTDTADNAAHRVFEVHTSPEADHLRRTSRLVRDRSRTVDRHQQGAVYSLPAGVFHQTVVEGETATIALGRHHADGVDLALGGIETPTHRISRFRCDRDETMHVARMVVQRLAESLPPQEKEKQWCHGA